MKRVLLLFVLLLMVGFQAFAQTHQVVGKVLDETGQGFPGAGVSVKGTAIGTVTDVNGSFTLDVPDGTKSLTIQAVGYQSQDVAITGESMLVHLKTTSRELEGTVVTALGIKREKRDLGYSSTTVTGDELTAGNNSSALSGLAGKVAGANITSSTGGPGGSTRIVLRGEKSFQKDNNALIVIDGVIMNNYDRTSDPYDLSQIDFGNSANDIDPDEIESITVLEGPAAAALYGAAGANGAVMITTKTGKKRVEGSKNSKLDITYKATYTMSDILKYPEYQTTYGTGAPGVPDDRGDNFSWGPKFTGQVQPWGQVINGQQQVKPYVYDGDSRKNFFNHGKDLNNFVSLSGGSENSTYYLSLNALNSNGVVPNTFYNKYSVRFNGTTQLTNNFYSSINVNYINSYSRVEAEGQGTGGIMQSLLQIPTDVPIGGLKDQSNIFNKMDYIDADGVHRFGYFGSFAKSPYWAAENYDNRNKTDRIIGDITLGYKKGEFNVYDRVGVDATDDRSFYKTPYINSISFDQSIYYPSYPYLNSGGFQQINYTGLRFYNDLIANYAHNFNKDFGINVLLGNNVTMENDQTLNALIDPGTNGLVIPGFYNFQNNVGPVTVANTTTQVRRYSVYGDIKLNYKRELYLELTGRNEWSSTLSSENNPYFYPGASAGWVFTERLKGKFKDNILNYGKIRAGIASVSADALAYANNSAAYSQGAVKTGFGSIIPPFNGIPAYQIGNTFGNPDLKPELTKEYEIGVDLSFFKDKIALTFNYYDDETTNLITPVPVPPSSGYAFNYINLGDVSNKGEEISLRATPISTKWGLKWDVFGTYTHNVSNIERLTGGVDQITLGGFQGMGIVAAVGHPYGTFYAADIETDGHGHTVVDAATGLPVATPKPQYLGTFQPKFQASWGTDLSYKGIKLHVLFTTKQGGEIYSQNKELMDFVGSAPETAAGGRDPRVWTNSVNATTTGTTTTYTTNTTKYLPYNYWVTQVGQGALPAQNLVDASYIKLQEVALSWKIPVKYYNRTPFGTIEVGAFGNNLVLWTAKNNKYDDPEATSAGATGNGQGFNFAARPTLRNYGVSLKVTF